MAYDIKRYGFMGRSRGGTWCGPESDDMHRWLTVDDVRDANAAAGFHFFDGSTIRFFRSRIGQDLYQGPGGYFFVTSEQFVGSDRIPAQRLYTVRQFMPDTGDINTVGDFNKLTRRVAHHAARRLAAGIKEPKTNNTVHKRSREATHG